MLGLERLRHTLVLAGDDVAEDELVGADKVVLVRIIQGCFIVAVVYVYLEALRLLEVVVDLELLHEVRIVVIPDDLCLSDLLLHHFPASRHRL